MPTSKRQPFLLYHDSANLTENSYRELDQLASLQDRFGARGLRVLHVSHDVVSSAGDGSPPKRHRGDLIEALHEHEYPFVSLMIRSSQWPRILNAKGVIGGRAVAVIDRSGRLRLRMQRAWTDTAIARQDAVLENLLRQLTNSLPYSLTVAEAGVGAWLAV